VGANEREHLSSEALAKDEARWPTGNCMDPD
jgi:hypothetical protein